MSSARNTKTNIVLKRDICPTCRQISSARNHWLNMPCRDCGGNSKFFTWYLISVLMDEVKELRCTLNQIHRQHTHLFKMVTKYHQPIPESLRHNKPKSSKP
jgi:hypothetical protein